MKILVYGAGVIGSIYAAKLYEAGYNVTLLGRSNNYERLRQSGIVIKDILTGKQTAVKIPLTQHLEANDFYDLIIVTVRLDQVDMVIPVLKNNNSCPLIMFMLNKPDEMERLISELKPKHIILGFPGTGGVPENTVVKYMQVSQQPTTIGELNGETSDFIINIKSLFERAGFKVKVNDNMQAWLKTHAVFVACAAAAIMKENGSSIQLGKKRSSIQLMVKSIKEGFVACKTLGMPIAPKNLKIIFMIMPQWFCVWYWQKAMQGKTGTLAIAPHANAAKEEMQLLAKKVLAIVHLSSSPTPALDNLLSSFINLR